MNKWVIVRILVVALVAAEAAINGDNWLPSRPVDVLWLTGMLIYGIIVVPLVVWAQRLNPRNTPNWHFPSWRRNPLSLRDPMQFFHMAGFLFLAAGLGVVGRDLADHAPLRMPHGVLPAFGVGMIIGSYVAARMFRQQLQPRES